MKERLEADPSRRCQVFSETLNGLARGITFALVNICRQDTAPFQLAGSLSKSFKGQENK